MVLNKYFFKKHLFLILIFIFLTTFNTKQIIINFTKSSLSSNEKNNEMTNDENLSSLKNNNSQNLTQNNSYTSFISELYNYFYDSLNFSENISEQISTIEINDKELTEDNEKNNQKHSTIKINPKTNTFYINYPKTIDFSNLQKYKDDLEKQYYSLNKVFHKEDKFIGKIDMLDFISSSVPLKNNALDQMIADIEIGTPPQKFNILIDSGSSELWVTDSQCQVCGGTKNRYKTSKSSTYSTTDKPIDLNYGTGHAYGFQALDKVAFKGMTPVYFNLVRAYDVEFKGSDGILGISYINNEYGDDFSFIHQLKKAKVIEKHIFSQKYTSSGKGQLIIGDYADEILEKYEETKSFDFLGSCKLLDNIIIGYDKIQCPYWACNMKGFFFGYNEKALINYDDAVIFDTGSNYNYVTSKFWDAFIQKGFGELIQKQICREQVQSGTTMLLCLKNNEILNLKAINFVFGNWSFYQKMSDIFFKDSESGLLISNYIKLSSDDLFIFGEKFLKSFISVYNKEDSLFQLYGKQLYDLNKEYRPNEEDEFPPDVSNKNLLITACIVLGIFALLLCIFLVVKLIRNCNKNSYNMSYFKRKSINNNTSNVSTETDDSILRAREALIKSTNDF